MLLKIIFLTFLLCACVVQPTQQALQIIQTRDLAAVSRCKFIAPVRGGALVNEPNAASRSAQAVALNAAAELGATHVMWQNFAQRGAVSQTLGDAYICN